MAFHEKLVAPNLSLEPAANWKRGGVAFLLAVLFPGGGLLYDRRWKSTILYQFYGAAFFDSLRPAFLTSPSVGFALMAVAGLFSIFICCLSAWFGFRRTNAARTPSLQWWQWTLAIVAISVSLIGAGTDFYLDKLIRMRAFKIASQAMEPTLKRGDRIVVDLVAYKKSAPKPGDLIVFEKDGSVFPKRVLAVGGDVVDYSNADLLVNGEKIEEPYRAPYDANAAFPQEFPEHVVADGEIYVLGDNRENSYDSRYFGDISRKDVIGKVIGTYWPLRDARSFRGEP
jgi:signal peptidase I